jgi:hypothetical protein
MLRHSGAPGPVNGAPEDTGINNGRKPFFKKSEKGRERGAVFAGWAFIGPRLITT